MRAVLAQSFERIHRSNLVGMGILPLEFTSGQSRESLGLDGYERYDIEIPSDLVPRAVLTVRAVCDDGQEKSFQVRCRIDSDIELAYYRNGGILPYVVRTKLGWN
ncbi:Aconitate hydratase A [bioreactor metagenome]|uniref:Aconitate hydratase A n=1 Tax=bioreactor metagenome TaxID=1076179 RepID=A0A645I1J2_9ZZZZ